MISQFFEALINELAHTLWLICTFLKYTESHTKKKSTYFFLLSHYASSPQYVQYRVKHMADTVIMEDDFVKPINGRVFDQSLNHHSLLSYCSPNPSIN